MSARALLVTSAIDPAAVNQLAARAASAYERWDATIGGASEEQRALFHHGHIPADEIGNSDLEGVVNNGFVADLVRYVFRWPLRLQCPRDFLLRRILPPAIRSEHVVSTVPYHQDEYFRLLSEPPGSPQPGLVFTMWLPLVACGREAPGLTVVPGSDLPIVMGAPEEGWGSYAKRAYNGFWSPEMQPGDLLIFTSRVIHGSYITPTMTKPRYSVEIRGGIN